MARTGMATLISRVRALTSAGTAEYVVDATTWWSDQNIQDTLDSNSQHVVDAPLDWLPESIGGGTVEYKVAQIPFRDLEEAASGTARWAIRDAPGAFQGTANYTPDYRTGLVTFTSDQGGTAYYWTGYTFDVYAAAADIWLERLAHFQAWYQFSADGQTFNRQQAWEHAEKMEKLMRSKSGQNILSNAGGELRFSQFVRTDLERSAE
jgi:hypothetical protein